MADLVLPQLVPLCLKFSSDGEKKEFAVYDVLVTIDSFILGGHLLTCNFNRLI